jgi:chemotaxis response regulator CheB
VCDDSRVFSTALQRYLEHDPAIKVVATFPDAEQLLAGLDSLEVDLITMDLEMPGLDPVQAIQQILARRPVPIVLLSAHAVKDSEHAAAALGAGALDAISKSRLVLTEPDTVWAAALRSRFKRLGSVRHPPRRPGASAGAAPGFPARPGSSGSEPRPEDRRPWPRCWPHCPSITRFPCWWCSTSHLGSSRP